MVDLFGYGAFSTPRPTITVRDSTTSEVSGTYYYLANRIKLLRYTSLESVHSLNGYSNSKRIICSFTVFQISFSIDSGFRVDQSEPPIGSESLQRHPAKLIFTIPVGRYPCSQYEKYSVPDSIFINKKNVALVISQVNGCFLSF